MLSEKNIELYIHYDYNHERNINIKNISINMRYAKMRRVVELVCCDYNLCPIFSFPTLVCCVMSCPIISVSYISML